jgi:hypothetical protein
MDAPSASKVIRSARLARASQIPSVPRMCFTPRPGCRRSAIGALLTPLFLYTESSLVIVTVATTYAAFGAPAPSIKIVLAASDVVVIAGDFLVANVHFQVSHWVVTGELIRSVEDLRD